MTEDNINQSLKELTLFFYYFLIQYANEKAKVNF